MGKKRDCQLHLFPGKFSSDSDDQFEGLVVIFLCNVPYSPLTLLNLSPTLFHRVVGIRNHYSSIILLGFVVIGNFLIRGGSV